MTTTSPGTITLDLNHIEELFQAPPANPFSTHEIELLGQNGIDFLRRRYVRRWPKRRDTLDLLIRLPAESMQPGSMRNGQLIQDTRAAIRRYCDVRVHANREARRLAMAQAQRELLIALAVTFVAILMLALYAASEPAGFWGYVLALATLFAAYAAALAVWDALESWFFDW